MTNEECWEALCRICEMALHRSLTLEERGNAALAAESIVRQGQAWKLEGFREKTQNQTGKLYRQMLALIKESWDRGAGKGASETRRMLVERLYRCKRFSIEEPKDFILIRTVRDYPAFYLESLRSEGGRIR